MDVMIIDENGKDYKRNYRVYNQKAYQANVEYKFPKGTTEVLKTYDLIVEDAMDLD